MIRLTEILIGVLLIVMSSTNANEGNGIIGRKYIDGFPVIYKFLNEMPPDDIRNNLPWLTVISWKYDGTSNNGMPLSEENQKMIILENAIEKHVENEKFVRHVYSRTGNMLKEFVYYIHDREQFLDSFNKTFSDHPRYPIEIFFL